MPAIIEEEPDEITLLMNHGAALDELLTLSFERLKEILELDPQSDEKTYTRIKALQVQAAIAVTTLQARIDEGRLKGKTSSKLDQILDKINRAEKAMTIEGRPN